MTLPPILRAGLVSALTLFSLADPARAADTGPALALASVEAHRGAAGVLVRVDGTFPDADLVQLPMAVQLMMRQLPGGTHFIRFELPTGSYVGDVPALAGGLDASNVDAVLAQSAWSTAASMVVLRPGHVELLLDSTALSGDVEAQLFFVYDGAPIFSNPILFSIPPAEPQS